MLQLEFAPGSAFRAPNVFGVLVAQLGLRWPTCWFPVGAHNTV